MTIACDPSVPAITVEQVRTFVYAGQHREPVRMVDAAGLPAWVGFETKLAYVCRDIVPEPLPDKRRNPRFNKRRNFRKGEHHDMPIEQAETRRMHNRAYRSRCRQALRKAVATQNYEDLLMPRRLPWW